MDRGSAIVAILAAGMVTTAVMSSGKVMDTSA